MKTRIPAIARKETLHIIRDWRSMGVAFMMPAIMILLFGWAITFDIRNLKLAVADQDKSKQSRALIERFTSSGYFKLAAVADHPEGLMPLLDSGAAQVAIAIPEGYATRLARMEECSVQVILDGSDNNTAIIASNYVDSIVSDLNFDLIEEAIERAGLPAAGFPPFDARVRVWFNPGLDSANTIVPGLVAVVMMIVAALLTSLTVVRERENGSMEGLIATPVKKYEVLVGKMMPYLAIALIDCMLVAGLGVFVFGVPFAGSLIFYMFAALIFSIAGLAIGLMASVSSSNQLMASQIVLITTMLPSFLLSGFMFPIKSMPGFVQVVTHAVPARYFIAICRGSFLKDAPIEVMAMPLLFLIVFSVVMMTLAVVRFEKKL